MEIGELLDRIKLLQNEMAEDGGRSVRHIAVFGCPRLFQRSS
jgi:hypothetical protein